MKIAIIPDNLLNQISEFEFVNNYHPTIQTAKWNGKQINWMPIDELSFVIKNGIPEIWNPQNDYSEIIVINVDNIQQYFTIDENFSLTPQLSITQLFPHPPELNLNIRVDISDTGIRQMTKSPYKPLIDLALLAVNEDNATGVTIWLSHLENDQMTAEQVSGVLESFGAQILIKE